jgi:hypothetical protein
MNINLPGTHQAAGADRMARVVPAVASAGLGRTFTAVPTRAMPAVPSFMPASSPIATHIAAGSDLRTTSAFTPVAPAVVRSFSAPLTPAYTHLPAGLGHVAPTRSFTPLAVPVLKHIDTHVRRGLSHMPTVVYRDFDPVYVSTPTLHTHILAGSGGLPLGSPPPPRSTVVFSASAGAGGGSGGGSPGSGRAACIALAIIGIVASIFMLAFGIAAGILPLAISGGLLCAGSIAALSLAIARPHCIFS